MPMQIDLNAKIAIVTGGARGIGRDIVRILAHEGVTTVAIDINRADLDELGVELSDGGFESAQFAGDVRDFARLRAIVADVVSRYGRVDILVNNAGVTATASIEELTEEQWDFAHDVNLKGTFLMSKAVIPVMKKQGWGRIINASSFAAIVPTVNHAAYASSKAAVAHFTRALAGELGPYNVTVNAYAPGMVPTEMNGFTERPAAEQSRLLDTLTLRRWGSKDDIGNLICFLASDRAGYITGTLIDVSGGKFATQIPRAAYDDAAGAGDYEF
jgi:3-oxoacyl-[acyl-carrier protein] reductase